MRPLRPVVFAGVSLSHAEIRELVDAECRPPIRTGDLDRLRGAQRTIVIIDGELAGDEVISVDEIERAISRGFDVRGASSVGALRAAEFHERGMRGCGWIYQAFRDGRIFGTEEIAVLYDPQSLCPLTIPLVTVRFWLDHFVGRGVKPEKPPRSPSLSRPVDTAPTVSSPARVRCPIFPWHWRSSTVARSPCSRDAADLSF